MVRVQHGVGEQVRKTITHHKDAEQFVSIEKDVTAEVSVVL